MLSQRCKSLKNILPISDALHQHICGQPTRVATFKASVWWKTLTFLVSQIRDGEDPKKSLDPLWTTLKQDEDACYELIRCGSQQGCVRNCKCGKAGLQCSSLPLWCQLPVSLNRMVLQSVCFPLSRKLIYLFLSLDAMGCHRVSLPSALVMPTANCKQCHLKCFSFEI